MQTAWVSLHTSEPKWVNTKRELRGSVLRSNVRATGSPSDRKGVPGEIFISPVSQRGNGIGLCRDLLDDASVDRRLEAGWFWDFGILPAVGSNSRRCWQQKFKLSAVGQWNILSPDKGRGNDPEGSVDDC